MNKMSSSLAQSQSVRAHNCEHSVHRLLESVYNGTIENGGFLTVNGGLVVNGHLKTCNGPLLSRQSVGLNEEEEEGRPGIKR